MGFGATENGQYGLLPVFEALSNLSNALGGGMHAPKYFILGIRLLWTLKDTFAKLYILRTSTEHCTTFFPKKKVYFLMSITTKNDN